MAISCFQLSHRFNLFDTPANCFCRYHPATHIMIPVFFICQFYSSFIPITVYQICTSISDCRHSRTEPDLIQHMSVGFIFLS